MSSFEPPSGTVLRDPENAFDRRTLRVLIAVPMGVLFLAIIVGFGPALVIGLVALGVFALVSADELRAMVRWQTPQLEIASTPYPLGSAATITYRRQPKRPTDVADCMVECRLFCQERVIYRRGTDTTTDTNTVFESITRGLGHGTPDGLAAAVDIEISAHAGGPSLELSNNQVRWFVEVKVQGARLPKEAHIFALQVAPELAASYRGGLQDS